MAALPPSVKAAACLGRSSQQLCERFSVHVLAARIGHIESAMARVSSVQPGRLKESWSRAALAPAFTVRLLTYVRAFRR